MSTTVQAILREFRALADPEKAAFFQRFFKTKPGEYAEGDIFLGLTVPQVRSIAKRFSSISLPIIVQLLHSPFHEVRLGALIVMTIQFPKTSLSEQTALYDTYLSETRYINNWDLVDVSAHKIVGAYLQDRPKEILSRLARSELVWDRRIAIISTMGYARTGDTETALKIAELLVHDSHDLIHKAVGWVLRELGKVDPKAERTFLASYYKSMPRTMLRYAIERFPEQERQRYLKGEI